MFSGIVEEVGVVTAVRALGDGLEFEVRASTVMSDLKIDDSISVQGVCLTVVERNETTFRVQAVEQTLAKTTLRNIHQSSRVNLERAVLASTRLGGHVVQGHVDGVGVVRAITTLSTSHEISISFDARHAALLVETGSVCCDGVSLTVARLADDTFTVAIIPHTWNETSISDWHEGTAVNIEFDILGKYILRYHDVQARGHSIT